MSAEQYIEIVEDQRFSTPERKTKVWRVTNRSSGSPLGQISWYGPWRQYCFIITVLHEDPDMRLIFNKDCLRYISDFAEARTTEHREAKAHAH